MENKTEVMEEILANGSEEELQELKSWLFRENIRLVTAAKELERMQEQFQKEKEQFRDEMKQLSRKIAGEKQRLKEDNQFFEKKMEILQSGFSQLDIDRRRLDKEWARLAAEKELLGERSVYDGGLDVSVFFQGVRNPLALKKRYKDLIKIFHPDNLAGDKDVIQSINREYEDLKGDYEGFKQA
ncbi:MAG: hypothetical protein HFI57_00425 [Lachnospiraceae bacterium]|nr:hypothetical protein [Lachnospiraceae bacterium]